MDSLRSVAASLGRLPRALRLVAFALIALAGAAGLSLPHGAAQTQPGEGHAVVLDLEGAVTSAMADYLTREMRRAAEEGARLVVVRMDTPGGLDASMRAIIREILASPVPVATWVGPSGARAASAGTYILYASHVAAMAPGTNLGAATPVQLGGGGGGSPFGGQDEEEAEAPAEEVAEDDATAADGGQTAGDAEPAGDEAAPARRFEPRTAPRPRSSTTRSPTSAASPSCATATPTGPSAPCARPSASARARPPSRTSSTSPRPRSTPCSSAPTAWRSRSARTR
jgi:membrane-bound serine protease (ClpP class)